MRMRILAAALALTAAPVLAQPAPPDAPPPPMPPNPVVVHQFNRDMLSDLSPAGQRVIREAMQPDPSDAERAELAAARRRMLQLLEADRLDVAALRRAMSEERRLAELRQQRRQEEMLEAFRRLSVEDRKAFAEGMREQHERIERVRRDIQKRAFKMQRQMMERARAASRERDQ